MLITKYKDEKNLSEIYQQVGVQFAFISAPKDGYKQCHQLVKCRDFLQDAVRCSIPNSGVNTCSIYGFNYTKGDNPPIDLCKMRMLATYSDKKINVTDCSIKMMYALKLIHYYEELMGIKIKTRQKQFNHKKFSHPIWVFTGDSIWVRSPVLISLYTFLIRLGDKKIEFKNNSDLKTIYKQLIKNNVSDANTVTDNDVKYLETIYPKLEIFIKNYKKILFTEKKFDTLFLNTGTSISTFHNYSGILSLSKKNIFDSSVNNKYKKCINN